MSEGIVQVEVHAEATSKALRDLADQLSDRRVPNKEISIELVNWVTRNFEAEGALNEVWASLSPDYAKWKAKHGYAGHILVLSGLLRGSFNEHGYDNDTAIVGTPITYAPYHEHGAPEHNLPARPMLPPAAVALEKAIGVYDLFLRTHIDRVGLT